MIERLTEYHNGVAVIKNKTLLKQAMKKLAEYEDAEERGLLMDHDTEKVCEEIKDYFIDQSKKEKEVNPWDICEFNADIQAIVRRGGK